MATTEVILKNIRTALEMEPRVNLGLTAALLDSLLHHAHIRISWRALVKATGSSISDRQG